MARVLLTRDTSATTLPQLIARAPQKLSVWPVMLRARSEAKNATARPIAVGDGSGAAARETPSAVRHKVNWR
jgi:hypothetical protein